MAAMLRTKISIAKRSPGSLFLAFVVFEEVWLESTLKSESTSMLMHRSCDSRLSVEFQDTRRMCDVFCPGVQRHTAYIILILFYDIFKNCHAFCHSAASLKTLLCNLYGFQVICVATDHAGPGRDLWNSLKCLGFTNFVSTGNRLFA